MKKITGLMLCLLLAALCAFALADVEINDTNFPDENFRNYVKKNFDTDGDGSFNNNEIAGITSIEVGEMNISSLAGIEHFTALSELICYSNHLTELDISRNKALDFLFCNDNQLAELDVSKNTSLSMLWCSNNRLSALDVSNNTGLGDFRCDGNPLRKLDVSRNTTLVYLSCCECQLTSLDVSRNADLSVLLCFDNQISTLDVSSCPTLCNYVRNNSRKTVDGNFYDCWTNEYEDLCVDGSCTVIAGDCISDPIPVSVTSIKLNKTKATLTRTSKKTKPTLTLKADVSPDNAADRSVTWKSSNAKVARVSQNGKVTAVGKGTCTITCTAKDGSGVKASCKITVRDKLVTKITLNKTKASISKGKTLQLKVKTVRPADAFSRKVTWKSSDRKIATVDKNGKVTAKKEGTCTITCIAADGSEVKAACRITVK